MPGNLQVEKAYVNDYQSHRSSMTYQIVAHFAQKQPP